MVGHSTFSDKWMKREQSKVEGLMGCLELNKWEFDECLKHDHSQQLWGLIS